MSKNRLTPRSVAQNVNIGASSAASAAFSASTKVVRLVSTADCYLAFSEAGGSAPVATSAGIYLVAKVPEFFGVDPSSQVACLEVSGAGVLSIAEGYQL
jgi:hypothetical protein